MKKIFSSSYWWLFLIVVLLAINYVAGLWHTRIDLTKEKRYTLSEPTKQLLSGLDEKVDITIFLDGELPAGFKKLANSTNEMMQDFKERGKGNIVYRFEQPGEGLNDELKKIFVDSLQQLGLNPMNIRAQVKEGEGEEQRLVYPGALITYKNRTMAVDLLQGQSAVDGIHSLNNAEALLEYKFANAIHKLSQDSLPLVGYLMGNGEPMNYQVYGLVESLKQQYAFRFFPIDSFPNIPSQFKAILIIKPSQPFNNDQKLKLDQYVMNGGKLVWLIDNLYAEMDSLQRTQNDFIAFDRGLNVEDQLFKYGIRINQDLVQALNCDKIPSVVGNMGDKPQVQLLPWPYFPLLSNYSNHPISKNLDYVVAQFPHSIDTVKSEGIKKTVLLATAAESRTLHTPAKVSWNSIQTEDDLKTFNQSNIPVAVLLEGRFHSLFSNRLSAAQRVMLEENGTAFKTNIADNKMVVIADADIALNAVSQKEGPLPLGMNMYTKYQYANKDFLMNTVEYLVDHSGILETRGKDFTLRLLDKKKVTTDRFKWQLINVVLPVVLMIVFGAIYQWFRKRKYSVV